MKPLVSVIIPCYNVENWVREAIESVLNQTYSPLELILVDNGSSDRTYSILEEHAERYLNVYSCQELKPGASAARNKGLEMAAGEWLQFLDADDLLLPQKIEHQMSLLGTSKEQIVFVAGGSKRIFLNGKYKVEKLESELWVGLMRGSLGNTCGNLWKKSEILAVGGWSEDQESSQEYELMFRLLQHKPHIIWDYKVLTHIRERACSISSLNIGDNQLRATALRVAIYQYLKTEKTQETRGLLQILLQFLIKLGREDFQAAKEIYTDIFMKDFVAKKVEISATYRFLHNHFGFVVAQRVYNFYKWIF